MEGIFLSMKTAVLTLLTLVLPPSAAVASIQKPTTLAAPQPAVVLTRFIAIEWGDAKKIAAQVQEELGEEIHIIPDPRTNRIFLMGPPDLTRIAEARIRHLDF